MVMLALLLIPLGEQVQVNASVESGIQGEWHTFLGGSGDDYNGYVTQDSSGNVFACGGSFAAWGTPIRAFSGGQYDAFVTKLDSGGNLQWLTFLGGTGDDSCQSIMLDSGGNLYIAGQSSVTWGSPLQAYGGGGRDAFAARLDPSGNLVWHTFTGGPGYDASSGAFINDSALFIVGGSNASWGTPVSAFSGGTDAMVVKLQLSDGALLWHTFLGGSASENCLGGDLDPAGNIYITGMSNATWGLPIRAYIGGTPNLWDGYAAKLDSSGNLVWNTFLGGSGDEDGCKEIIYDSSGDLYTGCSMTVTSWGTPVVPYSGAYEGLVARLTTAGDLVWHTYVGGPGRGAASSMASDNHGGVFLAGSDNATWGTPENPYGGDNDAWVARVDQDGYITWNTFMGSGTILYYYPDISVGSDDKLSVLGMTAATWGTPVRAYSGGYDVYVVSLGSPINQPPEVDAGGPYTGDEGSPVALSPTVSDPDGDALTYLWTYSPEDDACAFGDPAQLNTTFTCYDNAQYDLTLTVSNSVNDPVANTAEAVIENVVPVVTFVSVYLDPPVQVGGEISAYAEFTDPGTLDIHTAVWDWDDTTTSPGTVTGYEAFGSHVYGAPDVYMINVTITDDDGDIGVGWFEFAVIFDPEGGFVTGGGWIDSPAGAYVPDPTLTGKATFGFVAKYLAGSSVPTGQTEFQLRSGDLNFHSGVYEWLVVAGHKAQYQGTGTVNGAGDYGFMLTVIDAALAPGTDVDLFRLKIWDSATGDVLYDTQMGAADDADPATELGGGSIVIHTQ